MKKVVYLTMAMVCTLALGAAYANEGAKAGASDKELYNGITDFSGNKIETPGKGVSVEGAPAGGHRSDKELYNGVTEFSGFKTEAQGKTRSVEDAGAGARGSENELYNGVTDFSGCANDCGAAPVMPIESR